MNFNTIFLKSFRVLLLPFALLYGLIIVIRNWLYDKNYLHSAEFGFPLVCVGNLSVGGTGKSPMVEYLIKLLTGEYNVATLSRGYKRKTRGYALAGENTTALEIGDEPMQFHKKFPGIAVAVGEARIEAVPQLLHDRPETQILILDDAFQHRAIKAGFNILLTEYNDIFSHDFFLPTGDLRDARSSAKRADIIVVTKCPDFLGQVEKQSILKDLGPLPHQKVFFTSVKYGRPYHIVTKEEKDVTHEDEILLVCGIANPKPLKQYLAENAYTYYQQDYSDHHIFSIDDLAEIEQKFAEINNTNKFILTTEKDAVRLEKFKDKLSHLPLYVLPIEHNFLFDGGNDFDGAVIHFIKNFQYSKANEQEERQEQT
ncbi:MAG TPA: tetraacyldisaccharide 4'-kinase [Chitinophagaceae bacterium]|nr:tetraacyldisaccharide 4'-kinase [Chitinophagaceae bacterium]